MNTVFQVTGGIPLKGTVKISGSKNAALPMLAATLLCPKPVTITNVPDIEDIRVICEILIKLGCRIVRSAKSVTIDSSKLTNSHIDPELAYKLRGSVLLLAPILHRMKQVTFSVPGGCVIGERPIHVHLESLATLGAKITQNKTSYVIKAPKLKGTEFTLSEMSVTGTSTAIMAAVLASGKTVINLAACEPETDGLVDMLLGMGANIKGKGTTTLVIQGQSKLKPTKAKVIPDRIEAGTFAVAAVATKGSVTIDGYVANHLQIVTEKLKQMGVKMTQLSPTKMKVEASKGISGFKIQTHVYPNFPTDIQPVFSVLGALAQGQSEVFETMYTHRLGHLAQLVKMGVKYQSENPHQAKIFGPTKLKAATLVSEDIRAGAAVLVASLAASGTSTVSNIGLIDRGYEDIEGKLSNLGAKITRVAA